MFLASAMAGSINDMGLVVTDIEIDDNPLFSSPESRFSKQVPLFYVKVTVKNFSTEFSQPDLKLKFYDQVTNQEIVLNQVVNQKNLSLNPGDEGSVVFNGIGAGILLQTEAKLVAGKNYWVRPVVVGEPPIPVNDNKRAALAILGAVNEPIPELSLFFVAAIALGILLVLKGVNN